MVDGILHTDGAHFSNRSNPTLGLFVWQSFIVDDEFPIAQGDGNKTPSVVAVAGLVIKNTAPFSDAAAAATCTNVHVDRESCNQEHGPSFE